MMFAGMLTTALNHLLQTESWARERLRAHAGKQAAIRAGIADFHLVVNSAGLFEEGSSGQEAAVTITLPSDMFIRVLTDRSGVFQAAKLSGSADFAETLAFVFRNLRWDVEADLARVIGDIPARRLDMVRRNLSDRARESSVRLFQNFAEYASEDSNWLAPRRDVETFARDVDALRDDLARLEKRLTRL